MLVKIDLLQEAFRSRVIVSVNKQVLSLFVTADRDGNVVDNNSVFFHCV